MDGRPDVRDLVVTYVERPDVTLEYGLHYDFSGTSSTGGATSSPSQGRLQIAAGFELANPLGVGLAVQGLHAPDDEPAQLPLRARVLYPLRQAPADPVPRLRRDRQREPHCVLVREQGARVQHPAAADAAARHRLAALARPPAPAVGLHEQGHPVQRGDRERRARGGQPCVPERLAHRRLARLAHRPASRPVLDGHERALTQVPRLGRRLRAPLRPAVHVPAAAERPRLGPGLPRRASSPATTRSTCSRTASRPAGRRPSADSARTASARSSTRTRASAGRPSSC